MRDTIVTEDDEAAHLVRRSIPLWYAQVAWAKELLTRAFALSTPEEILKSPHCHRQQVPGTCWWVCPHGVGVDIYRTPDVGGIDFDFDKPHPDAWRLALFIERQVNDGNLPYGLYKDLMADDGALARAAAAALAA